VVRLAPASDDPAEWFAHVSATSMEGVRPGRLRVGIADDSVLVREALVRVLTDAGWEIVANHRMRRA
jgi:hypothetical protein